MTRARTSQWLALGAVVAVIGFAIAALVLYRGRPTPGTVFLVVGWMAILATGYFLARAVSTFDLSTGGSTPEELHAGRREELEREKSVVIEEIRGLEDAPEDLIHDLVAARMWRGHPLAGSILGTESSVGAFTADGVRGYWDRLYRPSSLIVSP